MRPRDELDEWTTYSLADDLDHDALVAPPVEFAVEDLLPRSEIELAVRDGHDHFTAHDLPFVMRVAVVFAGAVVVIALRRRVIRREPFEPALVVLVQSRLVVVDEDG